MAKVKVIVFGTEGGRPLKIQLGEQKYQIANGAQEIEQDFFDKIKVAYKDNVRLAIEQPKKAVTETAIKPAVEVKDIVTEKEEEKEVKADAPKRGRPKKS